MATSPKTSPKTSSAPTFADGTKIPQTVVDLLANGPDPKIAYSKLLSGDGPADVRTLSVARLAKMVYLAEPILYPELKIPATPEAVKAERAKGTRIERIAARAGVGIAKVEALYAEGTAGTDLRTTRAAKGRTFAETHQGPLAGEAAKTYRKAVKDARRQGVRTDAGLSKVAADLVAKARAEAAKK